MNILGKAAPWIGKILVLLSTAIFFMIAVAPLAHPAANAATQGIAFTDPVGATFFRVSFAGFPLACAAFLAYCLLTNRRTLTGLVFSTLVLSILLGVRIYGMEIDSTMQQSMPLVIPEVVLVAVMLVGVAIEAAHQSRMRRTLASV